MELEDHMTDLSVRQARMHEAYEGLVAAGNRHLSMFGKAHPEVLKSEWQVTKAMGSCIAGLVRLVPHVPEMIQKGREYKANQ